MIRVTVVYEAQLLRAALVELLRSGGVEVVASMSHWPQGPASVTSAPDVYVADAECLAPSATAPAPASVSASVVEGGSALLALIPAQRPGVLRRAHAAGATGFVDKNGSKERLLEAVHRVARGERFIDETLALGFLQAAEMPLTRRELSVLSLAANGAPVAEIAGALHLSKGTVRNYMASVIRKVGARNRVDAIRIAQGAGWT
ncbi:MULTISPECIES: response regulator transcription factor [Streptomyces]|uniref:response regulator transcription factor n=1 Tax=Streptomyces TaxID=1883 RepID=UPI00131851CF|nr:MULTISPECIES: DNA-binding response regulator [Streptomyces]QGZ52492.1 DNA-binding response regulator [Streptomyces sp. QHH-9511]GGT84536.1 DNA-binding response regulator [Streptomyces lateritius]